MVNDQSIIREERLSKVAEVLMGQLPTGNSYNQTVMAYPY